VSEPGQPDVPPSAPRRRRRRAVISVVAVVVVGAAVAATVLISTSSGADTSSSSSTVNKGESTAKVIRGDISSTDTVASTLSYASTRPLLNQASGVLTSEPDAGSVIDRGGVIYRVDDQPVVLMFGDVPAYREMSTSSTAGPDVAELKLNLIALGYGSGLTADDSYDSSTKAAVEKFQTAVGLTSDGIVHFGQVLFAPSAIRVADAKVDVGSAVQAGTQVLDLTATTKSVTAGLSADDANVAQVGTSVQVQLPNGKTVGGKVTGLAAASSSSSGSGGGQSGTSSGGGGGGGGAGGGSDVAFNATIVLDNEADAAAYDNTSVNVLIATQSAQDVLQVPVTALVALAEGGYAVEVVEPSGTTHLVAVKPGIYSDTNVQVSSDELREGDTVVVPSSTS
jgi:peptidoglycan hydrolase-like protein with peptidoglycan-binding domain